MKMTPLLSLSVRVISSFLWSVAEFAKEKSSGENWTTVMTQHFTWLNSKFYHELTKLPVKTNDRFVVRHLKYFTNHKNRSPYWIVTAWVKQGLWKAEERSKVGHSLRKEGRSSGLAVQPQVMRLMRVSRLGMSAGRLSRPVSGRDPRRTLNMICMGLVASAHRVNKRTMSECWMLPV